MNEIIARHGAPRVLLSDTGNNFLSKVVADVCRVFRIHKVNTSSYQPQTDGLVEVSHFQCMLQRIKKIGMTLYS